MYKVPSFYLFRLTMPEYTSSLPLPILLTIAVLGLALFSSPAWGQSENGPTLTGAPTMQIGLPGSRPVPVPKRIRGTRTTSVARALAPSPLVPSTPLSSNDEDVRFGRALAGSTIGAAVGGLLGAALITAAEPNENDLFEDDEPDPRGLGLLFIGGGAPVGAVLYTDIPRDHTGAYVMAVLGEVVLGGLGLALGTAIGGPSEDGQWIGAAAVGGAGIILGAAGGAVLAAPNGSDGALNYEDGSWHVQSPSVRVGIHRQPQPGLHGTVSLVNVEL